MTKVIAQVMCMLQGHYVKKDVLRSMRFLTASEKKRLSKKQIKKINKNGKKKFEAQFIQTYSLKAGLKVFGQRGRDAAMSEMKQLHDRVVFRPVHKSEMTRLEIKRALESLIFLVEKRDGRVKARTCANGSIQREYTSRDESASPTASTDSIVVTAVLDAKQRRDVMTADIPNAFVQTEVEHETVGKLSLIHI